MELLSVSQVARECGLSENAIRLAERTGRIAAIKVGDVGMRLFKRESVEEFKRARQSGEKQGSTRK